MSDTTIAILSTGLDVLITVLIVKIMFSWMTAFDVLNPNHPTVQKIDDTLEAIFAPIKRQIKKVIPEIFGIDPTPFVLIVVFVSLKQSLRYFFG